ncbi:MAG: penicillin-binding protein 2 [Bacteroidales bacterium]|jgi:penicillin-binding protein 2|nr:penicillin-binding protein 2 [Bacteroidales bacterium]
MKSNFSKRKYVIISIFLVIGLVYIARLFYIQVYEDKYILSAQNNVVRKQVIYPSRGLIYDRKGYVLVANDVVYDLLIIPNQLKSIDTTRFCELLSITKEQFQEFYTKARQYSPYKASLFMGQLPKEEFAYLQEVLYEFPGFFVQKRTLRRYPFSVAALNLGDVGEVNRSDLQRNSYYALGDYIGKNGLEKYYEDELRGKKGAEYILVDVFNREKGSYKDGHFDTLAIQGKNLYTGLDLELQAYGEKLMHNKIGSIVAIEPASGEILSLVSSPTFNPAMLVGRSRGENFNLLVNDSLKPLYNRALMATYPPGSTFKLINALVGLQENAINPKTQFSCNGPETLPIRCSHNHDTPLSLVYGIQESCNPYFWEAFRSILSNSKYKNTHEAYDGWFKIVKSFGLGEKFNTDLMYESSGNLPTSNYYDEVYRGRWNSMTVRSLSIGQGELLTTPIQLANMVAILANRGFYYPPHLVRAIDEPENLTQSALTKNQVLVDSIHFEKIIEGMERVTQMYGTAWRASLDSIAVCGKTGTVQNPHGKDHSVFIAFAPKENPKIAIAVVVENAGDYGGTWAAPIASLMMENYFYGEIKRKKKEKRILESDLILH